MAVIDRAILKGRWIVIPNTLQKQALEQLHINHMGLDKTKLLVDKSIYWSGIHRNIEKHIKNFSTQVEAHQTKLKEWVIHYKIPKKP